MQQENLIEYYIYLKHTYFFMFSNHFKKLGDIVQLYANLYAKGHAFIAARKIMQQENLIEYYIYLKHAYFFMFSNHFKKLGDIVQLYAKFNKLSSCI